MQVILKAGKGYLISAVIFLILSALITVLVMFSSVSMKSGGLFMFAALCISAFVFAIFTGNAVGKRGLAAGILSGLMFAATFVFLVSTALNTAFVEALKNLFYLIPVILSAIGGIIGANIKKA